MKFKHSFAWLLVLVAFVIVACGGPGTPAPAPTQPPAATSPPTAPTQPPAAVIQPTVAPTQPPAVVAQPTAPPAGAKPLAKARISINSKLTTPDPHKPAGLGAFIGLYLMGAQLFRLNPDFTATPWLAEKMDLSSDGLSATVTLKANAKFSDGSPVTAQDVVYTWDRSVELKNPRLFLLGPVDTVTATNERTVVFKLKQPFLGLTIGLADYAFSIFPKAKLQADASYFDKAPIVSAGQYILKEWTPGANEWAFEENSNFFGGPSMIKRLEFVAVPDSTSRVLQVTTGAIDYAYDLPASARADFPAEVKTFSVPILGMYHLNFNLEKAKGGPLADAKVRQAMSLAIDRDAISRRAFFGISPAAKGFLYAGPPEGSEVLPNGGKRDLAAAKALIAQTPHAAGFKFTIQPWGQRPGWTDAALIIKENLADLNISADVQPLDDATAIANLNSGNYDAQFSGNTQDPLTMLKNQFADTGTWTKWMHYDNPAVTKALNDAGFAPDSKTRLDLFHQAQTLAFADMPLIPISERVVMVGSRVDRKILYEANLQPGFNPRVATVAEFSK
jgi:peptide/nickel transport system substrate-binding protein